nr:zinc finger BED domain-containing protein RICESLEEPER 2-like [Tanacetum cinerariifolium]
ARYGSVFRYDSDYLREQFAGLVIQRALPFNHFDHEQTTRVFQNTMQPRYTYVSRSTLKRDAMKLWLAIEPGTWQMMKRVISFEEFSSPHEGGALLKMLIKVLTNFNLEDKVMSITLDNASNNTSAMNKLKLKYDPPMVGFLETKGNNASRSIPHGHGYNKCTSFFGASKSAFLTSGRVLLIRRTRLTPTSLEMRMCLKDHLDAKERKQDKCPFEIPLDFEEDVFDDEVQRNEAIPLSDEVIALDASSEGTLSLGGPRYDYMMSSEAEDDYQYSISMLYF